MGITYRSENEGRLTVQQMDDNFHYLEDQLANSQAPTYKVYTALLSQSGTASPTATVLQNTIGDITWTRNDVGYYLGTLNNAFPENKTFIIYTHDGLNGNTGFPGGVRISNNEVQLVFNNDVGNYIDIGEDAIESIEIRVYN